MIDLYSSLLFCLWVFVRYVIDMFFCYWLWSAYVCFLLCIFIYYTFFGCYTEKVKHRTVILGIVYSFGGWLWGIQAWFYFWCVWGLPVGSTFFLSGCFLCFVWSVLCVDYFISFYGLWIMVLYNIPNPPAKDNFIF